MQRAGDVRRRDRDRVVLGRGALGLRVEAAGFEPAGEDARFALVRVIACAVLEAHRAGSLGRDGNRYARGQRAREVRGRPRCPPGRTRGNARNPADRRDSNRRARGSRPARGRRRSRPGRRCARSDAGRTARGSRAGRVGGRSRRSRSGPLASACRGRPRPRRRCGGAGRPGAGSACARASRISTRQRVRTSRTRGRLTHASCPFGRSGRSTRSQSPRVCRTSSPTGPPVQRPSGSSMWGEPCAAGRPGGGAGDEARDPGGGAGGRGDAAARRRAAGGARAASAVRSRAAAPARTYPVTPPPAPRAGRTADRGGVVAGAAVAARHRRDVRDHPSGGAGDPNGHIPLALPGEHRDDGAWAAPAIDDRHRRANDRELLGEDVADDDVLRGPSPEVRDPDPEARRLTRVFGDALNRPSGRRHDLLADPHVALGALDDDRARVLVRIEWLARLVGVRGRRRRHDRRR